MGKYICIHGHFYQPPRENPWLEDLELQDSAYPYHDWNTRITDECYRQNAASRILRPDRKIVDIVNNYSSISFDFGPTLLYWLETHAGDVYEKILEADRIGSEKFSGHGPALALPYNHMILPLANSRDKQTQVIWGIRDFNMRFGRKPEGMWLPETAVDLPTLEVLAEQGINFTILSPHQAEKIRERGSKKWKQVDEHSLDTTAAYLCELPSGRKISLFFYDGGLSHDVAYGGLLHSGENFANRLLSAFPQGDNSADLVHIATDGESFGHHHRHGDMALAYCLHHIRSNKLAEITIYAEYLEKFPPEYEVQIRENSSWSCVHGVERWRSNCGCCADSARCGEQQWRAPLRKAMDWLRDKLAEVYQTQMESFTKEPWKVRNEYIEVINERSKENVNGFLKGAAERKLNQDEKIKFLKLMEMQRNAMLMHTSCGWFFESMWGIETVQILQYAVRAMQLCNEVHKVNFEQEFKEILAEAQINSGSFSNGRQVYEAYVQPAQIDLNRVAAHLALSSVFEKYEGAEVKVYCYLAEMQDFQRDEAGVQSLTTAKTTVRSQITLESSEIDFAALYLGDQNLFAALDAHNSDEKFVKLREGLRNAFGKGDTNEVIRMMNKSFEVRNYSLSDLFKDEQRRIMNEVLTNTWEEIESSFRRIYEHNYALMLMIRNMNMPLPKALSTPCEFVLNKDIERQIQAEHTDLKQLHSLAEEAAKLSLDLDRQTLRFHGARKINGFMKKLEKKPEDTELLLLIEKTLAILKEITPDMDLQSSQNVFFTLGRAKYAEMKSKAESGKKKAARWVTYFENLAQHLGLAVP